MQEQLEFNPSYSMLTVTLDPGEAIKVEPGGMVAQAGVEMETKSSISLSRSTREIIKIFASNIYSRIFSNF